MSAITRVETRSKRSNVESRSKIRVTGPEHSGISGGWWQVTFTAVGILSNTPRARALPSLNLKTKKIWHLHPGCNCPNPHPFLKEELSHRTRGENYCFKNYYLCLALLKNRILIIPLMLRMLREPSTKIFDIIVTSCINFISLVFAILINKRYHLLRNKQGDDRLCILRIYQLWAWGTCGYKSWVTVESTLRQITSMK